VNWLLSVAVAGAISFSPSVGGGTPVRPGSPTGANLTVTASYTSVMVAAPATYNWTITITNDVAEIIPGLQLTIALPSQFSLAATQAPASDNTCGGTLDLTVPGSVDLSGGSTLDSGICSFMIVIQSNQVGTYSFSTGAPQNGVDGSLGTPATISVTVDAPPSGMARFTPGTIKVGQTATLEIDISNPKTNPALFRGVALNEVLLSGLTGPTGTQTACGGNLALTAPNRIVLIEAYITPGTTCTLTIPVTATAPGTYVQQVSTLTTLGHSWTNIAPATLTVTSSSSAASPAAPGQSTATTPAATPSAVPSDSAAVSTASESPSPTASASASASTEASPSSGPADPGSSQPVPPTSLVIVILGLAAVALLGGFGVWWFRIRT
jgi:hypothetical protein